MESIGGLLAFCKLVKWRNKWQDANTRHFPGKKHTMAVTNNSFYDRLIHRLFSQ